MTEGSGNVAGGNSAGHIAATSLVLLARHVRSKTPQTPPALAAPCSQDLVLVMSAVRRSFRGMLALQPTHSSLSVAF